MNHNEMTPCPTCDRHVRLTERECPFCASALSGVRSAIAPTSSRWTSRGGALLVAGALAVAACESTAAAYGGPPPPEPSSGSNAVTDDASLPAQDASEPATEMAIYGAPPPR